MIEEQQWRSLIDSPASRLTRTMRKPWQVTQQHRLDALVKALDCALQVRRMWEDGARIDREFLRSCTHRDGEKLLAAIPAKC